MRMSLVIFLSMACVTRAATISGVVTDALTHLPLQGAAIRANGGIARTDIEGRYSLAVPPATAVQIAVSRNGYAAPKVVGDPVTVRSGETLERNFELRPLMKISGVVEDYDTGERIRGCHVFAMQRVYALGRAWHVPAGLITADTRNGQFEIRNLEPGDYILEIVPEETTPVTSPDAKLDPSKKFHGWSYYPDASRIEMASPITVTDAGDIPVTVRLREREPRAISGTVTVPASLELLRYFGDQSRTVATGHLSAAGPFRIAGLPEGDYLLTARGIDDTLAAIPITIGDHDMTDLRVAPAPGMIVAGTAPYEARLAGLSQGYAAVAGPGPRLDYVVVKTGSLNGMIKDGDEYVLLPGGTTLIGEFSIDLAPGKYPVAKLEGEETKLIRNKEFLQAKAAATTTTVEIKAGETTLFQP